MKPLLVLARITFVGCLWSIIFIEGIRVIVLENWRFDIFWPPHWAYAWNLWQSGWVIDTRKEWAFILILITFIPLWLMGWIALSLVPWETILLKIVTFPFKLFKKSVQPIAQVVSGTPVITKRKSYKEIRPQGKRVPIYDYTAAPAPIASAAPAIAQTSAAAALPAPSSAIKDRAASTRETINHTIFDLDDEDDDFDLDIDSFEKADIFKIDSNKKKKNMPVFEEDDDDRSYVSKSQRRNADDDRPYNGKSKARFEGNDFDDEDDDQEDYVPRRLRGRPAKKSASYDMEEDDDDVKPYERSYSSKRENRRSRNRFDDEEPRYEKQARRSKNEGREQNPKRERNARSAGGSIFDVFEEKGYDVLRDIPVGKNMADLIALSADKMLVCVVDQERGDWLADEERFNDEEPLWFSENSHRISPVRRADIMVSKIQKVLEDTSLDFEVKPYVIVTSGNIINAEDMFDVWADLDVNVVRFASGSPEELPVLSKAVKPAVERISEEDFNALKKVFKKLG